MKRFLFVSLAVVGVMAGAPSAQATVLTAGTSSTTVSTSMLAGLTLVDTWSAAPSPLSPPGGGVTQTIFGSYQEWVYKDGAGNLTFLEQVNLTAGSDLVRRITASNYGPFTTDVSTLTGALPATGVPSAGGTLPNNTGGSVIDRSADGDTIGFSFQTTPIPAPGNSIILVITTNAKFYNRLGTLGVIDATTSSNLTFQPVATPEPSTIAIAGLGALGMIGYGLRRRKALGA